MKRGLILAMVLTTCLAAAADEITIRKLPYRDIEIVASGDGKITFTLASGASVTRDLVEITWVYLSGNADFNKAESFLVQKSLDEAVDSYREALDKELKAARKGLIQYRLDRAIRIRAGEEVPAVPPEKPTAETGPDAGTIKKPSNDPLSSPEALGKDMAGRPVDPKTDNKKWEALTTLMRQEAEEGYKKALAAWEEKHNYRGRRVIWPLTLADVLPGKVKDTFIVAAFSEEGYLVHANVGASFLGALKKLVKGDDIEVFGTVESYLFVGPPPGPKANPSVTPNITLTDATVRFLAKPKPPASAPATEKSKAPATQPAPANPTP